jgi:uncharacterized repeat protein (TIGR03803 family)
MEIHIKNLFTRLGGASCAAWVLPALIAGLGLIPAGRVTAQTFTNLHSFTGSDGVNPYAGLILSGNTLYGTAYRGGSSGVGTVFAVNTNGTGFTNLHSFNYSDGANPQAGLILSGTTLYGTAVNGGSSDQGTVFAVNTDGTGFTNLYSFTAYSIFPSGNNDGANPQAGLILSGNTLYGTAYGGGSSGAGTVFAVHTDGTGFTNLYSFTAAPGSSANSDGAKPQAGLILSGNTLYGTAAYGGSSAYGTVFKLNADGTGFTNLHSFNYSDGANPAAGLILSGTTLYGTAFYGGSSGNGTVFAVNTDGTGFTNLHSFTYSFIYSDGVNPQAGLILSGNTLYGTAYGGGSSGQGTVFAVNTDGTGFTNLYGFSGNSDGANPRAGLILSGNTLYGTASVGGSSGQGTVFSLSLGPHRLAGTVVAWGDNTYGATNVPAGLSGVVTAIAAGKGHTVALKSDGTVVAWGAGTTSTGSNPEFGQSIVPAGLSGVTAIAAGFYHTVALKSDGTVVAWGVNGYGQTNVPAGLSGVTAIAAGGDHTVAIVGTGVVGPTVTVLSTGNNLTLLWPATATGYRVESALNLTPPITWSNVTGSFQTNGGSISIVLPFTGAQQFYRLVKP